MKKEDSCYHKVGHSVHLKKSPRFSSKQKSYIDEKFRIGEETGNRADPEEEDGSRKFTSAEFLSSQQIKSYFSRASAKLQSDAQAAAEQDEYSAVRAHIIEECQLVHPIMYDTYNLN